MGNPYTSQSISGYNTSPPSDDGANTAANEIKWATHKDKLADPLKTLAEGIDTAIVSAFTKIFGAGVTSTGTTYTVLAGDQGKLVRVTAGVTITTPAAATEGVPFIFAVKNDHSASITIDGNGSETIDGSANISLPAGYTVIIGTDGANWFTFNPYTTVGTTDIDDNAVTLAKIAHATQGELLYYGASGAPSALAVGTSGQVLKTQGAGANPQWADGTGFTLETSVDATNGAANDLGNIDFTGISSNAKRITFMLDEISTGGANGLEIVLGDSVGFETSGYVGSVSDDGGTSSLDSTGFTLVRAANYAGTELISGSVVLTLMNSSTNTWVASWNLGQTAGADTTYGAGRKLLSGTLTQVRLNALLSDTFDNGDVNIMIET